jgi:hypothetical protein
MLKKVLNENSITSRANLKILGILKRRELKSIRDILKFRKLLPFILPSLMTTPRPWIEISLREFK